MNMYNICVSCSVGGPRIGKRPPEAFGGPRETVRGDGQGEGQDAERGRQGQGGRGQVAGRIG